jgi:hypothetical protein
MAPGCGYESGTRRRIRSRREQTIAARSNSELVDTEPSLRIVDRIPVFGISSQ